MEQREGLFGRIARRVAFARWERVPAYPAVESLPNEYRSQAARGEVSPRRYVGRAAAGAPAVGRRGGERIPAGATAPEHANAPGESVAARVEPWSLRLAMALLVVSLLAIGLRATNLATPPVDTPVGIEATHAAFANVLSGEVGGALDPVRFFPPPAPWYGPAPALPWAGLPVYGWLTALAAMAGGGAWAGRAISALFGVMAGLLLFGVVRRAAGARAGLYSLLFFAVAPLSIAAGQQFTPAMTMLAAQALGLLALCRWRLLVAGQRGSGFASGVVFVTGVFAALVDPGNVFLAIPAAYLMLSQPDPQVEGAPSGWRAAMAASTNRGMFFGYVGTLMGCAALWRLLASSVDGSLSLSVGDGGGGVWATLGALLQGGTYVQIVGGAMEQVLTILGALLLFGGLIRGARRPFALLFHAWLLAGVLHVLADASRVGRHDDVLLPLLLPACALVGVGCAWAGSLPARVWLAITEQRREQDSEYTVSPHTSWLLDLPEERAIPVVQPVRPQAQIAFGKSVSKRAQAAGARARRAWAMGIGNVAVLGALAVMLVAGWDTTQARVQPSVAAVELAQIGGQVRDATPPGSRIIIAGPSAAELFYSSERTGWALDEDGFGIAGVQALQRDGASYLLSVDQDWLGHHPDYLGLLTNYSVLRLGRGFVLFDLNTKPASSNRLYFLESGHTVSGEFRRFWETHGGVKKLGYPISEEIKETSPLDGQERTVQYFERAVLEYHPEYAGTKNAVMLASVGRWVTQGRYFPTISAFKSTKDRAYFPQTGHSVKQAFLAYWQREGGVALFGYPISEELPEISGGDGKVYTVQYFERARFEWHPADAGTKDEVQLGLIGKQAWESKK